MILNGPQNCKQSRFEIIQKKFCKCFIRKESPLTCNPTTISGWLLVLSLHEFYWEMLNGYLSFSQRIFLCFPSFRGHFYVSLQASLLHTVCVAVTLSSNGGAVHPERVGELWACDLAGCWMTVSVQSDGSPTPPTPPQNQRNSTHLLSPRCPLVTHDKHPEDTWKPVIRFANV